MHSTQHSVGPATATQRLHSYCLKLADDGHGPARDITFTAFDATRALNIAQVLAINRSAELWCDGTKVCTICRIDDGSWEINGAPAPDR